MNIQAILKMCYTAIGENPANPRVVIPLTDKTQDIMNLQVQPVMVSSTANTTEMVFDANELIKALTSIGPKKIDNVIQLRSTK